jgi:uncharacterized membrane protein YbhN (UPF0104 family)
MNKRQAAFLVAKILFAVAVLGILFRKVDVPRVWNSVRGANLGCVAAGILVCLMALCIAAWRWQRLLSVLKIHVPILPLFCVVQIGQFFLMFLPGPVGDDLTRMLYVSRLVKGRAAEACSTVLLDRVLGLTSVFAWAVLCIPWQWRLLTTSHQTYLLAVGMLAAGISTLAFGALFLVTGHPTHRWFEHRLRSLPAFSFRDEAATIWGLYCLNKRCIVQVFLAACATQLLACLIFYFAGAAVGVRLPLAAWFSFVPIVLAANAAPITIAGLGVREYLLVLFLGILGNVGPERALAASFVVFAIMFAVSLLGGVVYILYRPKAAPAPDRE